MKIAIITDQHFGARKGSVLFHEYFQKFYEDIFFPAIAREGITTLIDMGDTFDNRRNIDLWSLKWAKENYFDRLRDMGVAVYSIVGNHTAYYKNNNTVNTIDLLLREYNNIVTIRDFAEYTIGGTKFAFLAWINKENEKAMTKKIKASKAKVACGHLELNGFSPYKGFEQTRGQDIEHLQKFDRVFSGHYHTRSNDGQVFYIGNPYEMYWNDVEDDRGFHFFDTETYELEPVNNPYRMFYNVYYNDTPYQTFDSRELEGKIVKVIVQTKTDPKSFERFIDKIQSSNVEELKIVENFDYNNGWLHGDDDVDISEENTLSILNTYIDESEDPLDKSRAKDMFKTLYAKASEVE